MAGRSATKGTFRKIHAQEPINHPKEEVVQQTRTLRSHNDQEHYDEAPEHCLQS